MAKIFLWLWWAIVIIVWILTTVIIGQLFTDRMNTWLERTVLILLELINSLICFGLLVAPQLVVSLLKRLR